MTVRKVVAGSVLAAGVGLAGTFGAGTASAGPGISYDPGTGGTKTIGIGDTQSKTGATATATKGSGALAISLFGPSAATVAGGTNNFAFALDGGSTIAAQANQKSDNNKVYTAFGTTAITGPATDNNIVNVGGAVKNVGVPASETSISVCGTALSAQSGSKISVGDLKDPVC